MSCTLEVILGGYDEAETVERGLKQLCCWVVVIIRVGINWREDVNTANDENLLIIASQALGAVYEQEFQAVWSAAS